MTIELNIRGMSCGGCANSLQRALQALPQVQSVQVDFVSGKAQIETCLAKAQLIAVVEEQGFEAD